MKVLDLGASYGINGALLKYPITWDMLRNRYQIADFEGLSAWADRAQNWGDVVLVEPTARFVRWLGEVSSRLEGGDFRVYILYTVVALVFFLILAVVVR